jgi:hypothetical protein
VLLFALAFLPAVVSPLFFFLEGIKNSGVRPGWWKRCLAWTCTALGALVLLDEAVLKLLASQHNRLVAAALLGATAALLANPDTLDKTLAWLAKACSDPIGTLPQAPRLEYRRASMFVVLCAATSAEMYILSGYAAKLNLTHTHTHTGIATPLSDADLHARADVS